MKQHANFKKIFLIRVFWFEYIFPIKFKIHILDLTLLPKNSVPLKDFTTIVLALAYFFVCALTCEPLDGF